MDYYLDLVILPDAELSQNTIMNVIGTRLHQFLVLEKGVKIGSSFPGYSLKPRTLGPVIRLHGIEGDLEKIVASRWLNVLRDYVRFDLIEKKPNDCQYIDVRRVQAKSSIHRLARRYSRRHGVNIIEALERYKNIEEERLKYPFLNLNSKSTGQRYNLFIKQSTPHSQKKEGEFNSFGLSSTASLPWF